MLTQADIDLMLNAEPAKKELKKFRVDFEKTFKSLGGKLDGTFNKLGAAIGGLSLGRHVTTTTRELFKLNNELLGTRNALYAVGKSTATVDDDIAFLQDTATDLGASFDQLSRSYARLEIGGKQLGLTTKDNRDLIVALSEAMVVNHSSAQDTFLIFNAIEQIMAKGKVQSEEIVRQFSQRIPGGLQIAADAVGKTTKEFSEMLRLGEVDPKEFFQGLDEALIKKFGRALPAALDTSLTWMKRFKEQSDELKRDLSTELEPVFKETFKAMSSAVLKLQGDLDSGELGQAMRTSFAEIFEGVGKFIQQMEKNKVLAQYGVVGLAIFGLLGPKGIKSRLKTMGLIGVGVTLFDSLFPNEEEAAKRAVDGIEKEIIRLKAEVIAFDKLGAQSDGKGGFAKLANEAEASIAKLQTELKGANAKLVEIQQPATDWANILFDAADNMRTIGEKAELAQPKLEAFFEVPSMFRDDWDRFFGGAEDDFKELEGYVDDWASQTTDAIVDMAETGKLAFGDLVSSIIRDIAKLAVQQQIVTPMFNALFGPTTKVGFGGGNAPQGVPMGMGESYANYSANGNAFAGGNVIPFAKGGVVSRPTNFGMSSGRTGLMGEAGPEAILPLKRGSGGKLGVVATGGGGTVVNVNVINEVPEVEVDERVSSDGNQIDFYIKKVVNAGLNGGDFDRSLKSTFNVSRSGS